MDSSGVWKMKKDEREKRNKRGDGKRPINGKWKDGLGVRMVVSGSGWPLKSVMSVFEWWDWHWIPTAHPSRVTMIGGRVIGLPWSAVAQLIPPHSRVIPTTASCSSCWSWWKRIDKGQEGIKALVISFVLIGRINGRIYGHGFPLLLLRRYAGK